MFSSHHYTASTRQLDRRQRLPWLYWQTTKNQHEQRAIASTETHRSKVHTHEDFLMGVPTAQWWRQLHYTVMALLKACMVWISEKAVREKTTTTAER